MYAIEARVLMKKYNRLERMYNHFKRAASEGQSSVVLEPDALNQEEIKELEDKGYKVFCFELDAGSPNPRLVVSWAE